MRLSLPLSCALAVLAAGCGGAPPAPGVLGPVPGDAVLYYDNQGAMRDSVRMVVRDEAGLRTLWSRVTAGQASPPPAPAVAFDREMLLVVGAGRKTPEDQIQVDSVGVRREMGPSGRMREVLAVQVRTTEGCGRFRSTAAFPVQIVRVRRFDGEVSFVERRERAEGCS
ncbi:MAG: hypothetical protein AB1941_02105 [Gemmatimonadota bacterium]